MFLSTQGVGNDDTMGGKNDEGHSDFSDFISDWFEYTGTTGDERSPEIFRRWCGISLVAGALERRVWVETGSWITFPNLYILLVAPPGTGKYIINTVREFWQETVEPGTVIPAFRVAPDSMTKASLIDTLAKSKRTMLVNDHKNPNKPATVEYYSLLISAEEFSVLMPTYDPEYIGALNSIYNNPPKHEEVRRTSVKEVILIYPQLNILGGVQPAFLGSLFPEEFWSTGLARRTIMIYSSEKKTRDPFETRVGVENAKPNLIKRLGQLSRLHGPIRWTNEAAEVFRSWALGGHMPVPEHSKLAAYVNSREMFVIKLAAVSSCSRQPGEMIIQEVDIHRAMRWLLEAETVMPDIFRAMIGKSDWQIVEEMHMYMVQLWERRKRTPIEEHYIAQFLGQRAPSDKVQRLFDLARRANVMECVDEYKKLWVPKPKHLQVPE